MDNFNSVYIVSAFVKCEKSSTGFLNLGEIRSVCWKKTYQEAFDVVDNNVCDIFEHYYEYVVIEKIPTFLYPTLSFSYDRTFFKWNFNKKRYEPTDEVEQIIESTHISPIFSIG